MEEECAREMVVKRDTHTERERERRKLLTARRTSGLDISRRTSSSTTPTRLYQRCRCRFLHSFATRTVRYECSSS
jgi:hypothetical protein